MSREFFSRTVGDAKIRWSLASHRKPRSKGRGYMTNLKRLEEMSKLGVDTEIWSQCVKSRCRGHRGSREALGSNLERAQCLFLTSLDPQK